MWGLLSFVLQICLLIYLFLAFIIYASFNCGDFIILSCVLWSATIFLKLVQSDCQICVKNDSSNYSFLHSEVTTCP